MASAKARLLVSLPLLSALLVFPSSSKAEGHLKYPKVTSRERLDCIRRARVWEPTDVRSKDLYVGPKGELPLTIDQDITCEFVPHTFRGWTEKFACRTEDGRLLKVKYNKGNRFKETYGEVLGTRLFWALGFHADRMIPLRVTCRGCPKNPWKYANASRHKSLQDDHGVLRSLPPGAEVGTYTFDPAAVEEKLDAEPIEERAHQGWSWKSLDLVEPRQGGATEAERDALKLLNAFVQNGDNKDEQNSLVCPRHDIVRGDDGQVTCRRPIMYVDDLGAVFGKGGVTSQYSGRVDYEGWRKRSVWKNRESCRARLVAIGGPFRTSTLNDPVISEEGRALLAGLMDQLSDAQITDLFRASHIERLHQMTSDGPSGPREVTVQDWVDLFKKKREEITQHPGCKQRETSRRSAEASGGTP